MQTVGELFSMVCQTPALFSISARCLRRKLPSVADHKIDMRVPWRLYQHILSQLLANCDPSKTRSQLSVIACNTSARYYTYHAEVLNYSAEPDPTGQKRQ